jgi:hypothetical protein
MSRPLLKSTEAVAYGVKWHKLERPEPWKPTEEGSEVVGYYLGTSLRDGLHGQYNVAMFAVPSGDGYSKPITVSGTTVISKIEAAQIEPGQLMRITFQGWGERGLRRGPPVHPQVWHLPQARTQPHPMPGEHLMARKNEFQLAMAALQRPLSYSKLSAERQWDIDKSLGILDWDGLDLEKARAVVEAEDIQGAVKFGMNLTELGQVVRGWDHRIAQQSE